MFINTVDMDEIDRFVKDLFAPLYDKRMFIVTSDTNEKVEIPQHVINFSNSLLYLYNEGIEGIKKVNSKVLVFIQNYRRLFENDDSRYPENFYKKSKTERKTLPTFEIRFMLNFFDQFIFPVTPKFHDDSCFDFKYHALREFKEDLEYFSIPSLENAWSIILGDLIGIKYKTSESVCRNICTLYNEQKLIPFEKRIDLPCKF